MHDTELKELEKLAKEAMEEPGYKTREAYLEASSPEKILSLIFRIRMADSVIDGLQKDLMQETRNLADALVMLRQLKDKDNAVPE